MATGHGGVWACIGLSQRARGKACLAVAVGSHWVVFPRPPGMAGEKGMGASYYGGAHPNPMGAAWLGVEGVPSTLPAGVSAS